MTDKNEREPYFGTIFYPEGGSDSLSTWFVGHLGITGFCVVTIVVLHMTLIIGLIMLPICGFLIFLSLDFWYDLLTCNRYQIREGNHIYTLKYKSDRNFWRSG